MEYKLKIFETNKTEGCMSLAAKFYPKEDTLEDRKQKLIKVKENIGKKYGFEGKYIFQPQQKEVEKQENYPDGKYIKITQANLNQEDGWFQHLPCDILVMDTKTPNVVIGHRMADCPIIIVEDAKNHVTAVSHCGASQINRLVPKLTIFALQKETNCTAKNIKVYISSCIKRENYQYDKYPNWATNKKVWEKAIQKEQDIYYIDLPKAIQMQLEEIGILKENITINPTDTYRDENYYSHVEEVKNPTCEIGQNFVGCLYQKVE